MPRITPSIVLRPFPRNIATGRRIAVLAAVLGACLFSAQSASAATTCTYDGTSPVSMKVKLSETGDVAVLFHDPATHLLLVNGNACWPAMSTNVDRILVEDTSGGGTTVRIEDPAAFGPGATPEGQLDSPEIEFELTMGDGKDHLVLDGSDAADRYTVGADGVNTGSGALDFDLEITGSGIDEITAHGNGGGDDISGLGGRGTGGPAQLAMHVYGDELGDTLAGGAAADDLHGGPGGDGLEGGLGTDYLDGGTDIDAVTYEHAPAGVQVALDSTKPLQQTGGAGTDHLLGFEHLTGSARADQLSSVLGNGTVDGGAGDDRVTGSGTTETLFGGEGDDLIDPGWEVTAHDVVVGGPGFDTVTYARAPKATDVNLATGFGNPRDGVGVGDDFQSIEAAVGSPFGDLLEGGSAANMFDGLGGADQINARGGDDRVRARDGVSDTVDCGDGGDSVIADARTMDSLIGCETADVLPDPAGGEPPATEPAADTTLRVTLRARRAQRLLRSRALVASVYCAGEPCKVRAGGRLGRLRLKRVTRSVACDTRTRVKIPLSSRAIRRIRAALADGRHPRLTLRVRATDAAGNAVVRKRSITAKQS
jgi:hypothetical protein